MRRFAAFLFALFAVAAIAYAADVTHYIGDVAFDSNVSLGSSVNATAAYTGSSVALTAAADDTLIKIGDGTKSFDVQAFGNTPTAYMYLDASASDLRLYGPMRFTNNSLGTRYALRWVAGSRGKPAINADINSATEATREIADPDFEILGTNGVTASTSFYAEGGILLSTAGASDDQVILLPHLDTNQTAWANVTWGTDQQTEWECDVETTASITNVLLWAGLKLTNTQVIATDNDQVFFRLDDDVSSGAWVVVSSIGGTDTETVTSVISAVNTRYHFKIAIDSARLGRCWINGALVFTTGALGDTVDLKPYIGIENDGGAGAVKSLRVYGQAISRKAGA